MNKTFEMILTQQINWADSNQIHFVINPFGEAHTSTLPANIFYPVLSTSSVGEYSAGKGNEFQDHMKSLCSSSALVVNVFEYWRQNERVSNIAAACGKYSQDVQMSFEKTHPILEFGTPPHLDIEFIGSGTKPLAVESKFTEPYRSKITRRNGTHLNKYLEIDDVWRGLDDLKQVAQEVLAQEGERTSWGYLDVPQLIKHILGLSREYTPQGFTLLYLWYDLDSEAKEQQQEILKFQQRISSEVDFRSMRYQSLFDEIQLIPKVDFEYIEYLRERYFNEGSSYLRNCDF